MERTYKDIIGNARFFALHILAAKDKAPSKTKAIKLLILHWQVYDLMEEIKQTVFNGFMKLSKEENAHYEELKALVPNSEELKALFIAIETPKVSTKELGQFSPKLRTFLVALRTKEHIDEKIEFFSNSLQKFLELTKEYD